MSVSDEGKLALRLDVRRTSTDDAEDYAGMCENHRERSRLLHEILSNTIVSDWGETDLECSEIAEPPVALFVDVTLQSADDFVSIVRGAAEGLAAHRIEGMYIQSSASMNHRNFGDHVVVDRVGPSYDIRVDNLTNDQLCTIFQGRFQSIPWLQE